MPKLFSTDGIFYKVSTVIYNLLILNFLWVLFSTPIVTIGASTTALFYVSGKIIRRESFNSILHAFWKSFKQNFKQATIIWLIFIGIFFLLVFNLQNIVLLGGMAKYLYPLQLFALLELFIVGIYIFPMLARHHITVLGGIKTAFYIGNRHLLTTIMCLAVVPGVYFLLLFHGAFILLIMPIYASWINYLLRDKFENYMDSDPVNQNSED